MTPYAAHLVFFSLKSGGNEVRLALDSDIASGGNKLSLRQHQIIALAKASILRNSKLLILNEDE